MEVLIPSGMRVSNEEPPGGEDAHLIIMQRDLRRGVVTRTICTADNKHF